MALGHVYCALTFTNTIFLDNMITCLAQGNVNVDSMVRIVGNLEVSVPYLGFAMKNVA